MSTKGEPGAAPEAREPVLIFHVPVRRVLRLTAEAFVVFLGVCAAFWLEGCRERQAEDRLREQIYQALEHDLAVASSSIESTLEWFDRTFGEGFLEPLKAGERPLLKPVPVPAGPPGEGWNAILAAGGLEVLDLELIRAVDSMVVTNAWVNQTAIEYNQYVRTVLVPELGETPDASLFYADDSSELRGKYLWYYHSLTTIQHGFNQLRDEIARLKEVVRDTRT